MLEHDVSVHILVKITSSIGTNNKGKWNNWGKKSLYILK